MFGGVSSDSSGVVSLPSCSFSMLSQMTSLDSYSISDQQKHSTEKLSITFQHHVHLQKIFSVIVKARGR